MALFLTSLYQSLTCRNNTTADNLNKEIDSIEDALTGCTNKNHNKNANTDKSDQRNVPNDISAKMQMKGGWLGKKSPMLSRNGHRKKVWHKIWNPLQTNKYHVTILELFLLEEYPN